MGIYPKDALPCHRGTCSTMLIAVLSEITEAGKKPVIPQQRNGYKKYTMQYYSVIKNDDIMRFEAKWMK